MIILEGRNTEIVCSNCYNQDFDLSVRKLKAELYDNEGIPTKGFISLGFKCKECNERMDIALTFKVNSFDDLKKIQDEFVNKYNSDSRLPSEEQEKIEGKA